jgi:putative ABC transport system permease protein
MWSFARSAVRAYRGSFIGSFLIVMLAAALLAANGVLMETGLRSDAPLLATVAGSFAGTAILVVVLVVASTFASALRQRHAQFALLRAVGATASQVRSMVTAEVAIVFAIAAPLGAVPGLWAAGLLTPVLESGGIVPPGLPLVLTPLPVVGALLLLFPTALVAARLAARNVTGVSPTAAVRGADAESSHLAPARSIAAVVLLVGGIAVAGIPFVLPGVMGSAAGSTSAFLLIGAAALAGPAIVASAARRAARVFRSSRAAPLMLAVINARGFSRRLTAAIIPLALLLALGTVQTGVNSSLMQGAAAQLREGLGADLVITSPDGVTADQLAEIAAAPGVDSFIASSVVPAEILSLDEDGSDTWEASGVLALTGSPAGLIDPDVTSGSLDDLVEPGTIAVAAGTGFFVSTELGDTVSLRFGDERLDATIVAVYQSSLGFGDYIVDGRSLPITTPTTTPPTTTPPTPIVADTVFAQGSPVVDLPGFDTVTVDEYVDETVAGAASSQQLGTVLLFVLIVFIAIAAANTLVMLTGARRSEFALLRRIGAVPRQLDAMIAIESMFVVLAALVIGTVSVLPALLGVAYGILGGFAPAFDWTVYGLLAAAVATITVAAMAAPAWASGLVGRPGRGPTVA